MHEPTLSHVSFALFSHWSPGVIGTSTISITLSTSGATESAEGAGEGPGTVGPAGKDIRGSWVCQSGRVGWDIYQHFSGDFL
jgi:hypothetical protein